MAAPNTVRHSLRCTTHRHSLALRHVPQQSQRHHQSTVAESQTFKLPDGRLMGFSSVGPCDGYPLFYLHGFPSSRLDIFPAHLADKHHLRIHTLERPGFGISTPQNHRTIISHAKDVDAFAKGMHIPRFAVIGGSGGGPYALACAHVLGKERVARVGLFASAGPYDRSWEHIPMQSKMVHYAALWTPGVLKVAGSSMVGLARWIAQTEAGARRLDAWLATQRENAEEAPTMSVQEERELMVRILLEGFAQGTAATVQEAVLLSTHWGFDLEDVAYDPILIWHGAEDVNAPIGWIRDMARRLQGSRLTEFEGETHFTVGRHLDQVLGELVPQSVR
ncbi:hydrolase [Emericellopsis cladophorae]|uniref:Hydrolase n=1 Tax=Emericellopsis cladophorae TaxID=2686198 RepID=A0A9P9Y1H8_9HYPO|nr:hydrolase [Emericellopsis cladophorae]KAI6781630.1 hydrolase [Emericellopsis cladophorae]